MTEAHDPTTVERELIGSVLLDNALLDDFKLTDLPPDSFMMPSHRVIWGSILNLHQAGDPIDLVTLTETLRAKQLLEDAGGPMYLVGAADLSGTALNADSYARIVMGSWRKRQLENLGLELTSKSRNGLESKQITDWLETKLSEITHIEDGTTDEDALALAEKYVNGEARVSTGFPSIDLITGGFPIGDVTVIAGRTSMGKSALAHEMALRIGKRDGQVLILSPDQPKPEIFSNQASRNSRVSLELFRTNEATDAQKKFWRRALQDIPNSFSPYVEIRDGALTLAQMELSIRRAARQGKRVIFLDHLQRVSPGKFVKSRREFVIHLTGSIKDLAREYNLAIVVLSQLSRDIEMRPSKEPLLTDLSESKSIEEDANLVLMLHRDSYYGTTPGKENLADVIVAKSKTSGRNVRTQLFFDPRYISFDEITPPKPKERMRL